MINIIKRYKQYTVIIYDNAVLYNDVIFRIKM